MKLSITQIGFVILVLLIGWNVYLHKANAELKGKVADRDITIKSMAVGLEQYKAKDGTWNQRLINERQSAKEIEKSKDSIIMKIKSQLENANIKLSNALALAYINQEINVDTVIRYVPVKHKDGTLAKVDTTLDFSKRPHIINTVKLTDSTASNNLKVKDELFLLTNAQKEFVNERKKFFLWRWFQKRYWVVYTDIHHTNPYIDVKDSKFITIVGKDGKTKTETNK